jgi:hypothetical protein
MSEQTSKSLTKSRILTTIASFLLVGILTALLTVNLTMAAFGNNNATNDEGMIFGTVSVDEVSNSFTIKNTFEQIMTKASPGDTANIDFDLQNVGTADMHVRFKIVIEPRPPKDQVDTSIFELTYNDTEYVQFNFDGYGGQPATGTPDYWFVRRIPLVGNLDTQTNDPPDPVNMTLSFPEEEMDNTYKNVELDIFLYVKTVQVANNGTQRDAGLPNYNVIWE